MDSVALGALNALLTQPTIEPLAIEDLARHVHDARIGSGLDGLAHGQGFVIERASDLPPGVSSFLLGTCRIVVQRDRDPAHERIAVAYSLAVAVARRAGLDLPRADRWRLALALLAPLHNLHGVTAENLAAASAIPRWAAAARIREASGFLTT